MKSGKISPFLFIALGVSLGLLGFFLVLANPFGWKLPFPTLNKSVDKSKDIVPEGIVTAPTPYLFLPTGKQTYNARGAENRKSAATSITFDPLDPKKDSNQTISATIESKEPVNSVTVTVNTDNSSTPNKMRLISGTNTSGVWSATHKITDTYAKVYNVSFEIITELGNKTAQPMPIR